MAAIMAAAQPHLHLLTAFVVAVLVAGLAMLARGGGGWRAGAAIPLGFLAAWPVVMGPPDLLPRGALAQLPLIALAGLGLGLVLDRGDRRWRLAGILGFAALAVWAALGFPLSWGWPTLLRFGLALAAWLVVLLRLDRRPQQEPTPAVMLAMLALGIGAVAAVSGDRLAALLAFALAAATGGLLLGVGACAARFGGAALLGGGGVAVALAVALGLGHRLSPWALAVLLLIPFADGTAARLPAGRGVVRRLLAPPMLALVCLLPVLLAVAIAYVAARAR